MRVRLAFAIRHIADRLDKGLNATFEACERDSAVYAALARADEKNPEPTFIAHVQPVNVEAFMRAMRNRARWLDGLS